MTSFLIGPTGRERDSSSFHTCSQYFVCTCFFISGTSATFSPVLPRLPFFIWFFCGKWGKSSRFDNFFCFTGWWASPMDSDVPWFSPTTGPFFMVKETSFATSSNAWSRRTVVAWKRPFAPGPRCGCKRCGETVDGICGAYANALETWNFSVCHGGKDHEKGHWNWGYHGPT